MEGGCPECKGGLQARLAGLGRTFPGPAMPPPGLGRPEDALRLRLALLAGEWVRAEGLWDALLRTLRPLGRSGRAQLAECFEACAALKEALGKPAEAARLRSRGATLRKDASSVARRAASGSGWDSHAWTSAQAADAAEALPRVLKARDELARLEAVWARRRLGWALVLGALAGVWVALVVGLPVALLATAGAGAGLVWARRT